MKINKEEFLNIMQNALPGVEKGRSLIEGADTFIFSNNMLHSYNDIISVSTPCKSDFEIAVNSIDFFNVVSKMPEEEISIEPTEDGNLKLLSGSVEAEMIKTENLISDHIDTLNLQDLEWGRLPKDFFDGMKLCKFTNNRSPQRGVFVTGRDILSTDTARMNRFRLSRVMKQFYIDDRAIIELLKINGFKHYALGKAWCHFKTDTETIFSCRRKDESVYPIQKIQEIVDKHQKEEKDIENSLPSTIKDIIDRIATLSAEIDNSQAIKMTIKQKSIEFFSRRLTGQIRQKVKLENPFKTKINFEVWVDPIFLTEISRKSLKFYIKDEKKTIRLVFYTDNYIQIVTTAIEEKNEEKEEELPY